MFLEGRCVDLWGMPQSDYEGHGATSRSICLLLPASLAASTFIQSVSLPQWLV